MQRRKALVLLFPSGRWVGYSGGAVLVLRAGLTPCAYNDTAGQFFAMDRVGKRAGGGLYADGGILVDVALSEFGCATQHDCDTTALCHAERLCSERS